MTEAKMTGVGEVVKKIKFKQLALFKQFVLALSLIVIPAYADAASLGKLSVFSALGEPLNAEIDVLASTAGELESLTAALASERVYLEQGVERTAVQSNIQVSVVKKTDGQVVVKLATDKVVTDSFLDMIVTLNWTGGVFLREYTLLLDPPSSAASPKVDVPNAISPTESSGQEIPPQTKSSSVKAKRSKGGEVAKSADGIVTQKGDSLTKIAKNLNVQEVSLDQLLLGLYKANSSAFVGGNMNRLRVGAVLAVPSAEVLSMVNANEAKQQVGAHATDWHAYANKLAATVAQSAATGNASDQTNTGKMSAKADDNTSLPQAAPRDVVKLSSSQSAKTEGQNAVVQRDDLAAKQNTIKESSEKLAALEKQIADMQKLLAIKNKTMADAQANAEPKPSDQQAGKLMVIVPEAQKISMKIVLVLVAVLALLAVLIMLVRRKNKAEAETVESLVAAPSKTIAESSQASGDVASSKEADILPVQVVVETTPQAAPLNISGIDLEFEPIAQEELLAPVAPPIHDAFNGDFSNLLKIQPVQKAPEASMPVSLEDLPEVDTKIELAAAYVDLSDKRGAKALLKEAVRDGSANQRARAQAMIDRLS